MCVRHAGIDSYLPFGTYMVCVWGGDVGGCEGVALCIRPPCGARAQQDSNIRGCRHACSLCCLCSSLQHQRAADPGYLRTCVVVAGPVRRQAAREGAVHVLLLVERESAIPVRLCSPPPVWGASGILSLMALLSSQECMLSHCTASCMQGAVLRWSRLLPLGLAPWLQRTAAACALLGEQSIAAALPQHAHCLAWRRG